MEVAARKTGPTAGVEGDPLSGPKDVAGEHTVGRTSDPWRAFEAWLFHLPGRRLEIHGPLPIAAIESWRTFLTNHADYLASIDFFVVPTATFHLLFGFIVLHHERRQIVHFGVTANPTMAWVAQQIREAFPWARRRGT